MGTDVTTFQFAAEVPAHLRLPGLVASSGNLLGGLPMGSWPRISIRGRQFHLVGADGNETHLQMDLDVVVIDSNPVLSKRWYPDGYDPKKEGQAPDCYSDNGIGPSSRATRPQAPQCMTCPNNAWGSRVNPETGAQGKACADFKKIAVLTFVGPSLDPTVYELDVPALSLKLLNEFGKACQQRGFLPSVVVIKLGFVAESAFPQLTFNPFRFISEPETKLIESLKGSEAVKLAIGAGDVVAQGQIAARPPQEQVAQERRPQTMVAQPATHALPGAEPAKPRRGRPPKNGHAEPVAQPGPYPNPPNQSGSAEWPAPAAQTAQAVAQPVQPAASVVAQPQLSDPALDALLDGMKL